MSLHTYAQVMEARGVLVLGSLIFIWVRGAWDDYRHHTKPRELLDAIFEQQKAHQIAFRSNAANVSLSSQTGIGNLPVESE